VIVIVLVTLSAVEHHLYFLGSGRSAASLSPVPVELPERLVQMSFGATMTAATNVAVVSAGTAGRWSVVTSRIGDSS
jgi:hypothetical protein